MNKHDIYLYDNSNVLKNLLNIHDEAQLDIAESEFASVNMMLLYDSGFSDFSPIGVCKIHKALFSDVYEWAGKYRLINIQKREPLLAGKVFGILTGIQLKKILIMHGRKSTA